MIRTLLIALTLSTCVSAQAAPQIVDLLSDPGPLRIDADTSMEHIGTGFATCDFNGDKVADLVLGAEEGDGLGNSRTSCGEVYLLLGRRGSWQGRFNVYSIVSLWISGAAEFEYAGDGAGCGDINGDGYDDILVGATGASPEGGARTNAGVVYIVFGSPSPPAFIDLADGTVPRVIGAAANDQIGFGLAAGDVNLDSIPDLVIASTTSKNKAGTASDAGRVDILFGRSTWPNQIDLRTESNVTIWGAKELDAFGDAVSCFDVHGDGTVDLVAVERLGDSPSNTRNNAGEVHIFRGRSIWPAEIDLATTSSDTIVLGPDPGDQIGRIDGRATGDLDRDGIPDLVLGIDLGDGISNQARDTGEVRIYELGLNPPALIDGKSTHYAVAYGAEAGDVMCRTTQVGDLNGDRIEDIACSANGADGPSNSRDRAGEASAFFGPFTTGESRLVSAGGDSVRILGAAAGEQLYLGPITDLNNDGIGEYVVWTGADSVDTGHQAVFILSPIDSDGDGLTQLYDNCPLVANLTQADADADLIGDLCDGDYDGDGQADGIDCAPNRFQDGTPPEVMGVTVTGKPVSTISWGATAFATIYDVERGLVSALSTGMYGSCQTARDTNPSNTSFVEPELPPVGDAFFFLVRGIDIGCPKAGSRGIDSSGNERVNLDPAACAAP